MIEVDAIEVLDGGLLTTVQDLGRFGYQRYGVPVSGAMDAFSLRAANVLVRNAGGAAALELTLLGPRLRFLVPTTIALAGADLTPSVDGRPIPGWTAVGVPAGAVLSFGAASAGVRAYLAVAGGLDVPIVLGSRSTYLRSKLGGFQGRALKAGDILATLPSTPESHPDEACAKTERNELCSAADSSRSNFVGSDFEESDLVVLRVVLGPQDDRFTEGGIRTFLSSTYTVTPQSDRMGCRMTGPRIEHRGGADIVSDGSPLGAVQVAGDGVPIVLMADRGTAGGYTKIATVISADVGRLAQAAPGRAVRFEQVTLAEAHAALREREARLEEIARAAAAREPAADSAARRRKAAAAAAAVARLLSERR